MLFGNIDTSRSEQKPRQLRIRTRERKLKAFLCGEVCIESVSSPPRATTQARTSIHTFHQWPSQSCQTVLSTIHQWLRPKCKATGSRGRRIKAQPGSSNASTNMVWILRFQSIIIACQTSPTGFSNTTVVLFCLFFCTISDCSKARCWAQLPPHPWLASLLVQTTDAESSDSKHILMNRHLENAVTQPRKVEDGERTEQKQKVDTEWLQWQAKQANKYKSSRVPLTQEGQRRWSVSS